MSVEMEPLIKEQTNLSKYVLELEQCGAVEVFVQGDIDKLRHSPSVFLTIHDVGSSYHSWVSFINHEDMKETKDRSLFLHISLPGQLPSDENLPPEYQFPDMQALGLNLVTVLDLLQVRLVVLLGDGAGANIACRFAMNHPTRVQGMVLINCDSYKGVNSMFNMFKVAKKNSKSEDKELRMLNLKNVSKYEDSYKKRDEITSHLAAKIGADTLVLVGTNSNNVKVSEDIHKQIETGICSIIKLEDIENVLEEAPEKVADALILFIQGLGLVPTVQRKVSRSISTSSQESISSSKTRKVSMEMFDIPNLRRLSLTSHNI